MDDFKFLYLSLCKEYHIEPQDCVIRQLKSGQSAPKRGRGSTLNLSSSSLTVKTCAVLGKILETDRSVYELKLADCMLNEEGVKSLAHGLSNNVTCVKLDLKGNNIRGGGTEALGRMLTHNKVLASICLEWNSMGISDASFGIFCEALTFNKTLTELDLRNNQITHKGAADLADVLKRNNTLRAIDLRWNSVGLIGGRSLLAMLQTNKTVFKLELTGNNTPADVLQAIETALGHNEDKQMMSNEYSYRTETLNRHVKQLQEEKDLQMSDLLNQIDRQEERLRMTNKTTVSKMGHLQEALEERKSAFNSVASKLQLTESELTLSEQKKKDLESIIHRLRQDISDIRSTHHTEISREKEERTSIESKLLRELSEANDRYVQLEQKYIEVERLSKQQRENIFELKEQHTHNQAESVMKNAHYEERLQNEKQKYKESQRETEQLKNREVSRIKQEIEETEKGLRDKIQKLERNRLDLEEEVSKLKSEQMSKKLEADENLMVMRQKLKNEEDQRYKALEERLRMVQISKDDLQNHSSQQGTVISELQSKNGKLMLDIETLKRRNDELAQEIAGKNQEMMAEVEKVRLDVKQKAAQLENEKEVQEEFRNKIRKLEKQMSELEDKHRHEIDSKDTDISLLKKKLAASESEISHIRDDEQQRMSMLQSAIMNFASRSPYTPRK